MNRTELYRQWLREEAAARMKGWDFSHLRGRYEEEQDLAWDYAQVVRAFSPTPRPRAFCGPVWGRCGRVPPHPIKPTEKEKCF